MRPQTGCKGPAQAQSPTVKALNINQFGKGRRGGLCRDLHDLRLKFTFNSCSAGGAYEGILDSRMDRSGTFQGRIWFWDPLPVGFNIADGACHLQVRPGQGTEEVPCLGSHGVCWPSPVSAWAVGSAVNWPFLGGKFLPSRNRSWCVFAFTSFECNLCSIPSSPLWPDSIPPRRLKSAPINLWDYFFDGELCFCFEWSGDRVRGVVCNGVYGS